MHLWRFTGRRIFLHFEAVDSAFFAWVNGRLIGYRFVMHFLKHLLYFVVNYPFHFEFALSINVTFYPSICG